MFSNSKSKGCGAVFGIALAVSACSPSGSDPEGESTTGDRQTAFRVRMDADAGLNVNQGWGGALNEPVTVAAESPFRLRFELEHEAAGEFERRFRLQYRRNGGEWVNVQSAAFPYSKEKELTPRVSIISTPAYENGAGTTNLLASSNAAYAGGAGVSFAEQTPPVALSEGQSEWEWPLVIRRYADGPVTNNNGDQFEFRVTRADGSVIEAASTARINLEVPPRLLAGTFVETPGRLGPWQTSDGDLYFIMEPAESDNVLMMVRSTDGGETWQEVDGANRPATGDLEGLGSAFSNGRIHIVHQISDGVLYHVFETPDASRSSGGWSVRDQEIATPGEPPVQVANMVARSDGSLVAIYGGPKKIRYRIRSPDGNWGRETVVDAELDTPISGPQAVLGANDRVHLAYTARDGRGWYRRIRPDGSLTHRQQIADDLGTNETDIGSVLPLVFIPETNTTMVIVRDATGKLWARRIQDQGKPTQRELVTEQPVVQNAVDSDQVGADAIVHEGIVHVLFIDAATNSIHHTHSTNKGDWSEPTMVVDDVKAQWVRGQLITGEDGEPAYGFVYDGGSNGGSGRNWFDRIPLDDS